MNLRSKCIVCAVGCLGSAAISLPNPQSATAAQADQTVAVAVRSADWEVRQKAFAVLIGADGAKLASQSSPAADRRKQLLIELLAVENETVAAKARTRRQRGLIALPSEERLSEEYANYYAEVIATVAALRDVRSVSALAGAITTGSMATGALISFGTLAVAPVAQRLSDEDQVTRSSATNVLSMLTSSDQVAKDQKSRAIIKKALAAAARDTDYHVRRRAIPGLVRLGDAESISIVQDLARNDAYVDNTPGRKGSRPVREAAQQALQSRIAK